MAKYFKSIGFTKEGTLGLLGNILAESSANPLAAEKSSEIGGSGGIGIVQWTASRRRNLEKAAGNNKSTLFDLDFQLKYLENELKSSYKSVFNKLTSSKSIEDSTVYVLEKFEVPATYLNRKDNPKAYEATKTKRINLSKSLIDIVNKIYS